MSEQLFRHRDLATHEGRRRAKHENLKSFRQYQRDMQNKDKMKAQPRGRLIDSEQVELTVIKAGRCFKENGDKRKMLSR